MCVICLETIRKKVIAPSRIVGAAFWAGLRIRELWSVPDPGFKILCDPVPDLV